MYTVVCDNCGKSADEGNEYVAWSNSDHDRITASESDWVTHEGKDYCPNCVQYDDDNNLVFSNQPQND